jgi:hypothetical protein
MNQAIVYLALAACMVLAGYCVGYVIGIQDGRRE